MIRSLASGALRSSAALRCNVAFRRNVSLRPACQWRGISTDETPKTTAEKMKLIEKLEGELLDDLEEAEEGWEEYWKNLQVSPAQFGVDGLPRPVFNVSPREYHRKVAPDGTANGTGTRKQSMAQVWIKEGTGKITVNNRPFEDYFTMDYWKVHAIEPLVVTKYIGKFDVRIIATGGGHTGQSGAIRMGLARALQNWDPTTRVIMKPLKLLTRDMRKVERKKPGQKKARKKYQWVKR